MVSEVTILGYDTKTLMSNNHWNNVSVMDAMIVSIALCSYSDKELRKYVGDT